MRKFCILNYANNGTFRVKAAAAFGTFVPLWLSCLGFQSLSFQPTFQVGIVVEGNVIVISLNIICNNLTTLKLITIL